MAPDTPDNITTDTLWQPGQYRVPFAVKLLSRLPRYGYTKNINEVLTDDDQDDDYVQGIVISSSCLLVVVVAWCFLLVVLRIFPAAWTSGRPERPPRDAQSLDEDSADVGGDDTSSTSASSHSRSESPSSSSHGSDLRGQPGRVSRGLSIDSSIFWTDPSDEGELTMADIAREQRQDGSLRKNRKKWPHNYSTTTNGQVTLVTTADDHDREFPQFRVYVPRPLRLRLLRTYHDCLVHPDDVSNADTMIYEFFTWGGIRRDVQNYVDLYRQSMDQGDNAAMVKYGEDPPDDGLPITLDVIAREQGTDRDLARMMERSPNVFSTATNGSIRLVTARGKDRKYRIVIPASLRAKVLETYHECLVNPTSENNFEKVLYVHFTWNGIHKDVEDYMLNEGLTEEMRAWRDDEGGISEGDDSSHIEGTLYSHLNSDHEVNVKRERFFHYERVERSNSGYSGYKPIGLDEIAKEQKKDSELRRLKKEEPFVFSTVRYGSTLLTTAQNFRDNKYRIVIPKGLQGRMLKTYRECLLNPTPDRNFDTLLYNHFTWNGIHDDVDYFVKNGGHVPEKACDDEDDDPYKPLIFAEKSNPKKGLAVASEHDEELDLRHGDLFERKIRMIRIAFLVSGIFTIISSVMFFEQGVKEVFSSLNDAQRGLVHTQGVTDSALSVAGTYLDIHPDIQNTAKAIGTYNTSQWCTPLLVRQNTSESDVDVHNSLYEIGVKLRDLGIRVESEARGVKSDLERLGNNMHDANATLDYFRTIVNAARILVIFVDIVVVCLMITCMLAWVGEQHFLPYFVRKNVTILLFVTSLILIWILSVLILIGAVVGADFCFTPDVSAIAFIKGLEGQLSPLVFMLMMYYITGCLPDRRPSKLESLSSAASSIGGLVHSRLNAIVATTEEPGLTELCGGDDASSKLVEVLELSQVAVNGIHDVLVGFTDISECQNFNSIYTAMVYDALCSSGVPGLLWVFFTSVSLAIFSMFMVTLRAAVHEY